jgi:hypothetical protein
MPPKPASGLASREAAEALAIEALAFIAADPTRLARFVDLCGLSAENLRAAAATPGFFSAILDHLAGDETLLLAFAANSGLDPSSLSRARERLAGYPEGFNES